jgi:copper resistance protein C
VTGRDRAVRPRLPLRLLVVLLLLPAVAAGHAALVRSAPASRAVVSRAPARVQLWFTERLEGSFSRMNVVDAEQRRVDTGDVEVARDDPRLLTIGVRHLDPGMYTVKYRVLSVDSHVVEGEYAFTVRPRR